MCLTVASRGITVDGMADSVQVTIKLEVEALGSTDLETCWLKFCFTSTETIGLLGTGAQDVHLDFHTAPELCFGGDDDDDADDDVELNVLGCRLTY